MSLYAISDLHLSLADKSKSMDKFGPHWENHADKIKTNWQSQVSENDTVLIAGDISWAKKTADALPDLSFIHSLPGKKILIKGNHDYWWSSTNKLNSLHSDMIFLKNTFTPYEDYAICGTKGWLCPNDTYFTAEDEAPYKKALIQAENVILKAKTANHSKIIVLMHYAPTNDKKQPSDFTALFSKNNIVSAVYGHLHTPDSFGASLRGLHNGTNYILTSCDYTNFCPIMIQV